MSRSEARGGSPGSHGMAAAERDRPLRQRLLAIAAEQAEPFLRQALIAVTAAQTQASLADEVASIVDALEQEEAGLNSALASAHMDRESLREYIADLAPFRQALSDDMTQNASPAESEALADLARQLSSEFASVFWSGMLTFMRRSAVDGAIASEAVVTALHVDGAADASRIRTTLVQAAADFGLGARQLEHCGARILRAVLDDAELARTGGDEALLHLPMGMRVDRAELLAAVTDVCTRHQFDEIPIVSEEEVAALDRVPVA